MQQEKRHLGKNSGLRDRLEFKSQSSTVPYGTSHKSLHLSEPQFHFCQMEITPVGILLWASSWRMELLLQCLALNKCSVSHNYNYDLLGSL